MLFQNSLSFNRNYCLFFSKLRTSGQIFKTNYEIQVLLFIKQLASACQSSPVIEKYSCNTKLCKCNKTQNTGAIQWLHPNQTQPRSLVIFSPVLPGVMRRRNSSPQLTQSEMKAVTTHLLRKLNAFMLSAEPGNLTAPLAKQVTGFLGVGSDD